MVNSIQKGKAFERTCAKILTAKTGVKWQRVPCSGAMQTSQNLEDSRFAGDLFTEDENYKDYVVECKISGQRGTLNELFSEKSLLAGWWKQAEEEAKGKNPVLLFKFRNSPIFILTPSDYSLLFRILSVGATVEHSTMERTLYFGVVK